MVLSLSGAQDPQVKHMPMTLQATAFYILYLCKHNIATFIRYKDTKCRNTLHKCRLPLLLLRRFELRSIISLKHPYEAHRKAFSVAGGRICLLDWSSQDSDPTFLCLVVASIFRFVTRMLWSFDGWGWFDALSNMSSGRRVAATGHCGGQRILEAERG
ncbi:hypothetical protein SO802_000385 [Lithocarpus litseifolius]|uniref:Uncharacterized protein n=1 Tax=Lithocarpus litseifolius TaxID=425828 RepID=A0AAW2DSD0_9ROSI